MIPLKTFISYGLLILGLDWHVFPENGVFVEGETVTVLQDDDKFRSGSLNQKTFHGGKCRLGLTSKGKLYIDRILDGYGYEQYQEAWSSKLSDFGSGDYYAKINQDDGSLVIYKSQSAGDKVSWLTASFAGSSYKEDKSDITKPFRLKIDEACVLRLVGKVKDYKGDIVDRQVWSNNRGGMTKLDIMQQGDIMSGFLNLCSDGSSGHVYCVQSITHLRLQSDCNIVQKIGFDGAEDQYANIVWDSKSEKNGDPDCYIFNNGDFVGVFEGKWDDYDRETLYPARQGLIWRTPTKYEQVNWEETELHGDGGFYPD